MPKYEVLPPIQPDMQPPALRVEPRGLFDFSNRMRVTPQALEEYAEDCRLYEEHIEAKRRHLYEVTLLRIKEKEELEAAYHTYVVNQRKRETDLTKLGTILVDARQELEAQVQYGGQLYAVGWQKRILEAELEIHAKREMIRQLSEQEQQPTQATSPDDILDILLEHRAMLNGAGLDTSRIDALIKERKR